MLQPQHDIPGINIAAQDVPEAGQSVPYIHVHILSRNYGDLDQNFNIYDRLESWEPKAEHHPYLQKLDIPEDNTKSYLKVQ